MQISLLIVCHWKTLGVGGVSSYQKKEMTFKCWPPAGARFGNLPWHAQGRSEPFFPHKNDKDRKWIKLINVRRWMHVFWSLKIDCVFRTSSEKKTYTLSTRATRSVDMGWTKNRNTNNLKVIASVSEATNGMLQGSEGRKQGESWMWEAQKVSSKMSRRWKETEGYFDGVGGGGQGEELCSMLS